ncbi:hypothetical protein Vadar_005490 [Vaccinium darrowii]|uniref:Uncharacterized protein n=1 Tax=Vaccinium darrowii TaxID=229202 RepID=A0ACB7XX02_9ERIC|nr:hypothetical protein Vadar_005490 [Vaccinium darrowii]
MTAAVVTKKDGGERMTMEFILPSKYKAAKEAPRPVDERVVMREESSHHSYEAEVDEDGEEYDEGDDDVDFLESERMKIKKNEGMELENIADNHSRGDTEAPLASNNSGAVNDQILIIKPIREIREKKLLHNQALDLLKFLCKEAIDPFKYFKADRNFRLPLERATSMGIHEIVEEILRVYPYAIYLENDKKQSIFQQAIVFRQEKVFNLIYQHRESWAMVLSKGDNFNNNALHLVGYVAHPEQLYRRAGAALQMQRELQWFKEVETLVLPKNREERNMDDKTPAQVFSDAHKELLEKGEKWMKDNASSCTIVASLIATVVFAAAITVPGGNKPDGPPNFDQQPAFLIFGIFNALALFSSIASVVLFLSILTSHYAEEDFLATLPKRLIIGLICLFLSLLFMMTAFGAILYLVFGKNKGWVLIPAGVLGCLPVTLFCALQFPLLKDMIKSTYGSDQSLQSQSFKNIFNDILWFFVKFLPVRTSVRALNKSIVLVAEIDNPDATTPSGSSLHYKEAKFNPYFLL